MDEKLRILKMIEGGTITAEEGAELLTAIGADLLPQQIVLNDNYDKKMFRIIVDSPNGDKVRVQFPVGAIKKIIKITGNLPINEKELEGFDLPSMMEAVSECLDDEMEGDFVNVAAADGTTVRIFVDK